MASSVPFLKTLSTRYDSDIRMSYFSNQIIIVLAYPSVPVGDFSLVSVELLSGNGANYCDEFTDLENDGQSDQVISSIHNAILAQDPEAQLPVLCESSTPPSTPVYSFDEGYEAPSTPVGGVFPYAWH